jgi:hypothetical protein
MLDEDNVEINVYQYITFSIKKHVANAFNLSYI